jgi:6-pyruvoyl-tetrahydropterin synthase
MYSVEVRDHVMIAHSIPGEMFGPAQRLHGATYVVDVAFMAGQLGANDVVVDIGAAIDALKAVLAPLGYRNLDELPQFKGKRTTTEALCRYVFDRLVEAMRAGKLGADAKAVSRIKVTLNESHVARASYEGAVGA